ncbi:Serine/threonine-protein kinase PrkC [Pseudovibrio sp. W64]|uniref:protein kinase domain-containing protein n=1 Tax=Pseudovibrio sp. W64 TaxID=1735583 RepID=UPI0007AEAE11|nr:protein kinase [Pseudovibrio sp. W64]KZK76253.1 Serine/threonine-protein kinase PrkC [Pseudovibrio sp. W64]
MTKSPRPLQNPSNDPSTQDAQISAWADNVITLLGLSESSAEDGQTEPDFDHPHMAASSRFTVSNVEEISSSEDEESDDEAEPERPPTATASPISRFAVSDVEEDSSSEDEQSEDEAEPEQPSPTTASPISRFAVNDVNESEETTPATTPLPSDNLKRAKRLGAGSYGEVSLFTDEESGKSIAFKTARSQKGIEALLKEAKIYGKLMAAGPHKNVVQCYGMHEIDGETGLAMEYVEGCEADDLFEGAEELLRENKLSHSQYWGALQFMANEVIDGLKHINVAGLSHNDIKGGNILFDKNSQSLKIADFGFSGTVGEDPLDIGTPEYSSPEAIAAAFEDEDKRDRLDDKQDGYAVGQMVFGAGEGEFNLLGAPDCDNPYAFALHIVRKLGNSKSQNAQADEKDSSEKALKPTDDPDLAGEPGYYNESYESEYTRFVNNSMQIDPKKRSSLDDMQQSQFLQDPLLQPDEAKEVLDYIMQQNISKSASDKS